MKNLKERREKATQYFVSLMERCAPNTPNAALTRTQLDRLTDQQFEALMTDFQNGKHHLRITLPNSEAHLGVEELLDIGESMGIKFWERVKFTDPATGIDTFTNKPALILTLPTRRQSQIQRKKGSLASDNSHIDTMTGQPTGDSKGSSISFPQALILESRGLKSAAFELLKVRGGDGTAFDASNRMIYERGVATVAELRELGSRAKSSEVLSTYLKAQHLDNNL
jgi:hypothetical protein